MKKAIVFLELKGFSAMASQLARDMEGVSFTPARVRAAGIHIVRSALDDIQAQLPPEQQLHLGGDTWFFSYSKLEQAAAFAVGLLRAILDLATNRGILFLKPSMAIGWGTPQLLGERVLDDESIHAYKTADTGKPFTLRLVGEARQLSASLTWLLVSGPRDEEAPLVDWQSSLDPGAQAPGKEVAIPSLLLDSEIVYSRTPQEAVEAILRHQESANNVAAFGGPVPADAPYYRDYLKATVALLREPSGPVFTILSYIPLDEPLYSYSWLELCRRMAIEFAPRFSFSAFPIPAGQLRPFSYQIFDRHTVHLGLRSYSPRRGTTTMSSAILFRNSYVAERFHGEFLENYRRIGNLDDSAFGALSHQLSGLTNTIKKTALQDIERLLEGQ